MRQLFVALTCLVCAGPATAAPSVPTLEPCSEMVAGYEVGVETLVKNALGRDAAALVTVYPAFTPEWAVALVQDSNGQEIVLGEFAQSYWYSGWVDVGANQRRWDPRAATAEVVIKRRKISGELATRLQEVWNRALAEVRAHEKDWIGLDGVTYYFRNYAGLCGSTWSPESSTVPGKLVSLADELRILAVARVEPEATQREQALLRTVTDFLSEHPDRSNP